MKKADHEKQKEEQETEHAEGIEFKAHVLDKFIPPEETKSGEKAQSEHAQPGFNGGILINNLRKFAVLTANSNGNGHGRDKTPCNIQGRDSARMFKPESVHADTPLYKEGMTLFIHNIKRTGCSLESGNNKMI